MTPTDLRLANAKAWGFRNALAGRPLTIPPFLQTRAERTAYLDGYAAHAELKTAAANDNPKGTTP